MKPSHCKDCPLFHSAGRKSPTPAQKRFNAWCSRLGREARKAVNHCKLKGLKPEVKSG